MCNCNRGGVEGCSNRAQKNTFFWENSCFGLQSYTDTSGEEWCRVGEDWGKENKEEKHFFRDWKHRKYNVDQIIPHQNHIKHFSVTRTTCLLPKTLGTALCVFLAGAKLGENTAVSWNLGSVYMQEDERKHKLHKNPEWGYWTVPLWNHLDSFPLSVSPSS